jgi:hypothetical protein
MSTFSPPPRSELVHELAAMLLDDQIDGPLAVALAAYSHDGHIDLSVRALPEVDPIGSLFGFHAPDDWLAFGVVTGGTARHFDAADGEPMHVRMSYLLDRHGFEASVARTDRSSPPLVDVCGEPITLGRIPDTCRRVLGIPTAPPDADPQLLWGLDWLDAILSSAVGRDLGSAPLAWSQIRKLHRGRASHSAPWSILRRECAAGHLDIGELSARDADWMDDGMFSRQAIAAYPELIDLLIDLAELLPSETVHNIIDQLDIDGAF